MTLEQCIEKYKQTGVITSEMRIVLKKNRIINGLGPQQISRWANYLLEEIKTRIKGTDKFNASSDYHDVNYYIGGTEQDRIRADKGYFVRLIKDILSLDLGFKYYILAYVAYLAVRRRGNKHFNYKK